MRCLFAEEREAVHNSLGWAGYLVSSSLIVLFPNHHRFSVMSPCLGNMGTGWCLMSLPTQNICWFYDQHSPASLHSLTSLFPSQLPLWWWQQVTFQWRILSMQTLWGQTVPLGKQVAFEGFQHLRESSYTASSLRPVVQTWDIHLYTSLFQYICNLYLFGCHGTLFQMSYGSCQTSHPHRTVNTNVWGVSFNIFLN